MLIQNLATFVGGTAVGLSQGWQEALVLAASLPFIAGASAWMARSLAECAQASEEAYAAAGSAAEDLPAPGDVAKALDTAPSQSPQ